MESEDLVLGVIRCNDGLELRVELRFAENSRWGRQVVWLMRNNGCGVMYARHGGSENDERVSLSGADTNDREWRDLAAGGQASVLDFLREVGRRHTFISWQPSVL